MIAQALLDQLWQFDDPQASSARLLEAAQSVEHSELERAELLTQHARALGLQGDFAGAQLVLDAVRTHGDPAVTARVALENGRLRNSSGRAAEAVQYFRLALQVATVARLEFLEIDALHMLAIADPTQRDEWALRGIVMARQSADPRTRRWLVSLHNNRGWVFFETGRLDEAHAEFEDAARAAASYGTSDQQRWAGEAIAEVEAALAERSEGGPLNRSRSLS